MAATNPFRFTTSRDNIRGHVVTLLGYLASGHCSASGLLQGCRDSKNRRIRETIAQFLLEQHFSEHHMVGPDGEDIYRKGPEPVLANTVDTLTDLVYGASRDHARALEAERNTPKPRKPFSPEVRAKLVVNAQKARAALAARRTQAAAEPATGDGLLTGIVASGALDWADKALQDPAGPAKPPAKVETIGDMIERHQTETAPRKATTARENRLAALARANQVLAENRAAKKASRDTRKATEQVTSATVAAAHHKARLAMEKAREEAELKEFIRRKTSPPPSKTQPYLQAAADRLRGLAWRLNASQTPGEVRSLADSILAVAAELDGHG